MERPIQGKAENVPDFEYFTIYDTKVGAYKNPLLSTNSLEVLRQIEGFMMNPANQHDPLVTHAEDYSIFKIGTYSKTTGKITPCPAESIAQLHEIKSIVQHKLQKQQRQINASAQFQESGQPALLPT